MEFWGLLLSALFQCVKSFLTCKLSKPWHKVHLNRGAIEDLHMWFTFLEDYNCVSFFGDLEWTDNTQLHLLNDASKWGFGLFCDGRWAYSAWPPHSKHHSSIQLLEISLLQLICVYGVIY